MAGALTALLYGYGGYGQGRQQRFQNQLQQQQQAGQTAYEQAEIEQEKARTALAQQQQKLAEDKYQRGIGNDPTTGKPVVVPLPTQPRNYGKGGLTDQAHIDLLYQTAQAYISRGYPDLAQPYLDRAKSLESILKQAQAQEGTLNRDLLLNNLTTNRDIQLNNLTTGRDTDLNNMVTTRLLQLLPLQIQGREDVKGTPSYADLHPLGPARDAVKSAQISERQTDQWISDSLKSLNMQASSQAGADKTVVNQNNAAFASGLNRLINLTKKNPAKVDSYIGQIIQLSTLSDAQKSLAAEALRRTAASVSQYNDASAVLKKASQSGGSNAAQNPTIRGAKIPQRSIWDMLIQNGATPEEATTLAAIAYAESGGDPTSVNPTDNNGKQTSWGLFQISDGTHNELPGWQDPEANTRMAIEKLRSRQGLSAWGTYNSGAYKAYLP